MPLRAQGKGMLSRFRFLGVAITKLRTSITHTPVKTKRTMSLALKPLDGRGLKTASR